MASDACRRCGGCGWVDGKHLPGFVHYETDDECPTFHFEMLPCPECKSPRLDKVLAERDKALSDLSDLQSTFDLQWKCQMKAIKYWQEKTKHTEEWPDLTAMLLWLMDKSLALDQVDSVLVVNWVAVKNGDYRRALHDLVSWNLAISDDPAVSETAAKRRDELEALRARVKELEERLAEASK